MAARYRETAGEQCYNIEETYRNQKREVTLDIEKEEVPLKTQDGE